MDVKYTGFAVVAVLAGVIYSNSAAVERALMQAFSQSAAAQRLAVLYTQGMPVAVHRISIAGSSITEYSTCEPLHSSP
jgi:hypothetical protein